MSKPTVTNFMIHGTSGISIPRDKWVDWVNNHQGEQYSKENGWGFGQLTHYSWEVEGTVIEVPTEKWVYSSLLPDASGFIGFEKDHHSNNCIILDAYGKVRFRLEVPFALTGKPPPSNAERYFCNTSAPYTDPRTGEEGNFGVTAWIEYAGMYYFELDYHSGQFLWGKEIRD